MASKSKKRSRRSCVLCVCCVCEIVVAVIATNVITGAVRGFQTKGDMRQHALDDDDDDADPKGRTRTNEDEQTKKASHLVVLWCPKGSRSLDILWQNGVLQIYLAPSWFRMRQEQEHCAVQYVQRLVFFKKRDSSNLFQTGRRAKYSVHSHVLQFLRIESDNIITHRGPAY